MIDSHCHLDHEPMYSDLNNVINRSKETLVKEKEEVAKKLKELGVEESLINLKGMTQGMLVVLGEKNIKKLKDFAELSSDELIGGFDEIKGKRIKILFLRENQRMVTQSTNHMVKRE